MYGVLSAPGLVMNETVVCSGRIPKREQIVQWVHETASVSEEHPVWCIIRGTRSYGENQSRPLIYLPQVREVGTALDHLPLSLLTNRKVEIQ
jgi:hypothetical protein